MSAAPASEGPVYRTATAARWLPRIFAGSLLLAAMLGSYRIGPEAARGWRYARPAVVVFGAILALGVLRKGGEVRTAVGLDEEAVVFHAGSRELRLHYRDIASIHYAPPFSASRFWLPATVLVDRFGTAYRLSALLEDGDRLLDDLLRRCDRNSLDSWAEALQLRRRMGRPATIAAIGYAASAGILVAAVLFYRSAG